MRFSYRDSAAERRGVHPWLLHDDRERPRTAVAALQHIIADSDNTGGVNYDESVCAACGDAESSEESADAAYGWAQDDGEGPAQAGEGDVHDGSNAIIKSGGEVCSSPRWSHAAKALAMARRQRSALRSKLQQRLELDVSEGIDNIRVEEPGIVSGVAGDAESLEGAAAVSVGGTGIGDTGVASQAANGAAGESTGEPEQRETLVVSTPPRVAKIGEQKTPRPGNGARKRARKTMERAAAWKTAQAEEVG